AQGRQPQTNSADPVVEILVHLSRPHFRLQLARAPADVTRYMIPFAVAHADLAKHFLLRRGRKVADFMKINCPALFFACSQGLLARFPSLKHLECFRGSTRKTMNSSSRRSLACSMLGYHQHGNVILRQFPKYCFHRAHSGTHALDPYFSLAIQRGYVA